jgi:small conductance mechanosensitive channel
VDESIAQFSGSIEYLIALVSEFGLRILGALVIFIVGRWVAQRVRGALRSQLGSRGVDPTLVPFTASLVYWGLMAFIILAVLGTVGVQTASAIALLGAAGLAVGLALQGTLSNFAAGVMLLIFRPFSVGNWVEVGGAAGAVQEIGIFSTILHTGDNIRVIVPNSQVYGQTLRNLTANPTRRIDLVIGVGYDDDLQVARDTLLKVLTSDDRVLEDPAPNVQVSELGDSSVDFIVRPWVRTGDYWPVRWDLTRRIKEELEAAGCSIPFPQRDVHLHGADGTGGNGANPEATRDGAA